MTQSLSTQQSDSVERIREIIFGPIMRDYDQRFEGVTRDLSRLQDEVDRLNDLLATRDAAQTKSLQTARQELRQADSDLRTETRNELARLSAQLTEQNTSQTALVQGVRDELSRAVSDLHADFVAGKEQLGAHLAEETAARSMELQTLRQELRKADLDLRDELRQIAQRLTDTKTDRGLLGDASRG